MEKMEIREIDNEKVWRDFVLKLNQNTFLQSIGAEKFNQKQGHETWKLGLYDKNELKSVALFQKIKARRGIFLQCSHAPQSRDFSLQKMKAWTEYLKNLAQKERCDFVRIAPICPREEKYMDIFRASGWRKAPIHIHAEQTVVVDLTKTEKEILMGMRKTTRQMCRKGEKMVKSGEVEIEWVSKISDEMLEVYDETAKRGHFVAFGHGYLKNEYEIFKKYEDVEMVVVRHEGKILSWGMVIYVGKRAFYHQGANILDKKIPAAYITHWEGMKKAKEKGAISYDFWGVSPENAENHPWKTISLFKRGFGGEYVELAHAVDYPISWKYWLTFVIETIRRKKRGF